MAEIEEKENLTHMEVMKRINQNLKEVLADPFLNDLSADVSHEEVKSRLAVEQGRAITVRIRRFDNEVVPVVVLQGATVNDLIKAFEREMIRRFKRSGKTTYVSWRYVWRTYWLCYNHQKLSNRFAKLASYGITNNDEVTFLKRLKREGRSKTFSRISQKRPFHSKQ